MQTLAEGTACRFDAFLLDPSAGTLFRLDTNGAPVPLTLGSRAFRMLCVLSERRGGFVSKQEMMEAVWPDVLVEENNLTVQMSALRRVLDQGREASCIQTVPGRGYRLLPEVIDATTSITATEMLGRSPPEGGGVTEATVGPVDFQSYKWLRPKLAARGAALCLGAAALLAAVAWSSYHFWSGAIERPQLSVVVLPFRNLSGDPSEDYLAEGITQSLTSDLAHVPGALVIDGLTARKFGSGPVDVRQVGRELGVRYAVEGGVSRTGAMLKVNAELVSAETGAQVWSDRFEEPFADLAGGQEQVLGRMREGLGIGLVDVEVARGFRERPTKPDAFDLILRARLLQNQPFTMRRSETILALYEQALRLDPHSVSALVGVAQTLMNEQMSNGYWASGEAQDRVKALVDRARTVAPASEMVLTLGALWLRTEGKCEAAIAAAGQLVMMFPNNKTGYYILGWCKTATGHADEEIALLQKEERLNPRDPALFLNYRRMGYDAMLLGKNQDAIHFLEQSQALNPDASALFRHHTYRMLAAVYARSDQDASARRAAAEADRLWPFDTVRGHYPEDVFNPTLVAQVRRYQDGLRLSGERDHADENADFGVPADAVLHDSREGYTPTGVPGATTVHTAELVKLIDDQKPMLLDTLTYSWGHSLPAAVGLPNSGLGGSVTDRIQERLQHKLHALTGNDLTRPVVAVGWNSERFDGRNLALRLVSMGFTHVYWYRGGREAWEVAGLPETDLMPADW